MLADVPKHLSGLDVVSRFPLRVSWRSALMPAVAAILAVATLFFEPDLPTVTPRNPNQLSAAQADKIEKTIAKLEKKAEKKEKKAGKGFAPV